MRSFAVGCTLYLTPAQSCGVPIEERSAGGGGVSCYALQDSRHRATDSVVVSDNGRGAACCFSSPCIRQKQKKQGVDGLISLFLCGVRVRVSVSFARLEAKLREGSSFGDGRGWVRRATGPWTLGHWLRQRQRGYGQLPGRFPAGENRERGGDGGRLWIPSGSWNRHGWRVAPGSDVGVA
jgi:hypothetical protein